MSEAETASSANGDKPLDTIWRVPDALWERVSRALAVYDPLAKTGRTRIDQRLAMDALIYRIRTAASGTTCLPSSAGDERLPHLPALGGQGHLRRPVGVATYRVRGVGRCGLAVAGHRWLPGKGARREKGALATPRSASGATPPTGGRRGSRSPGAPWALSRAEAVRLQSASPGRISMT